MNRFYTHSTVFAAAMILALNAQNLLFEPGNNALITTAPPTISYLVGGIFIAISIPAFTLVVLECTPRQKRTYFSLAFAGMLFISLLYLANSMFIECILTSMLAVGLLLALAPKHPSFISSGNLLILVVQAASMLSGIGILALPEILLSNPSYFIGAKYHFLFSAVFLLSPILTFISVFGKQFRELWHPRILAVPWLAWFSALLIGNAPVSMLLTPGITAAVLLALPAIHWNKISSPAKDTQGPLVLNIAIFGNLVILVLFTVFVNYIKTPNFSLTPLSAAISVNIVAAFSMAMVWMVNITTNQRIQQEILWAESEIDLAQFYPKAWARAVERLTKPLKDAQDKLQIELAQAQENIAALQDEISHHKEQNNLLSLDISNHKRRIMQLGLLNDVDQLLRPILDPPVAAQLTVSAIQRAYEASLVTIFSYDSARHDLVAISSAGEKTSTVPPGYRQNIQTGLMGRAARIKRPQYAPDTRLDSDHIILENQDFLSEVALPIMHQGQLKGMIVLDEQKINAFSLIDIETLEAVANRLVAAWNRSDYDQRLRELIRAGIVLSGTVEIESAVRETASATQQTLGARFVLITLIDQDKRLNRTAFAGYAPKLINYLTDTQNGNTFVQSVMNAAQIIRSRDVRKLDSNITIDNNGLRGFIGFPIRLRGNKLGVILAFGKQGGMYFTEEDESLATLISNQSAAAIETAKLYQELQNAFHTATQLYQLSIRVIQAEHLTEAVAAVAETAKKLSNASSAGIVLLTTRKEVQAQVQIDESGLHPGSNHPMQLVKQAMQTSQSIIVSTAEHATVCLPLQTPHRQYGAIWLNVPENMWYNSRYSANLQTLTNQAAIALERGILLAETRRQREHIQKAYQELEATYDMTLEALTSALDARDRETEGHCLRVGKLTAQIGQEMNLPPEQIKSLERGALLHDIGKIGISDTILLKPGPLTDDEWHMMKQHPDIGARIIEGIPFLQDALPVIRYHQERWDGSGYPIGLKGHEIPLEARIFAVADVFDALTSTRPYRQRVTAEEAIAYLKAQAGIHFDPEVVKAIEVIANNGLIYEFVAQ